MQRFCKNCGEKLKEDARFCPKCGYKILNNNEILGKETKEEKRIFIENNIDKKKVAMKIAVGIVAVVLVGGGIGVGAGYVASHQKITTNMKDIKKKEDKNKNETKNQVELKETETKLDTLLNEVDEEYLTNLCTYLPIYSSIDQISNDELCNIYQYAMQYGMQFHAELDEMYTCKERQIIPDDQFVEISRGGTGWFKKNAFDKVYEWTGITRRPEDLSANVYTYDDEGYYVHPTEALGNQITCKIVGKGFNDEKKELFFNVEKEMKDSLLSTANITVTEETVVIIPTDNTLGYQIKCINNGYESECNQ